jgi:micrococcal nuclease
MTPIDRHQTFIVTMRNYQNRLITAITVLLCVTLSAETICAGEWHRVKAVIDGDTLLLKDGRFVRYIGINAPEIKRKDKPGEPFGDMATRTNAGLIGQRGVRLEFDRQMQDHYGRLLAYVYNANGVMLNQAMLSAGMAYCLYKSPNVRYAGHLLDAQIKAMNASKGIWTRLGRTGGQVLGNKRSRRFHRTDCGNARKMSRRNRIHIHSQWQAFRQGYAPGRHCLGGMPVQ